MGATNSMDIVLFFITLLIVFSSVSSYLFDKGQCSIIPGMQQFDIDKMSGKWHVFMSPEGTPGCMLINLAFSERDVEIEVRRPLPEIPEFGFPAAFLYILEAKMDNYYNGFMRLSLPPLLGLLGPASVVIPKTDYESYAVVYTCKDIFYGRMSIPMILTRNTTLDEDVVESILTTFNLSGVNTKNLMKTDFFSCPPKRTDVEGKLSASLYHEREGLLPKHEKRAKVPDASIETDVEAIYHPPDDTDTDSIFFPRADEPFSDSYESNKTENG